jgi:hypothetical protein
VSLHFAPRSIQVFFASLVLGGVTWALLSAATISLSPQFAQLKEISALLESWFFLFVLVFASLWCPWVNRKLRKRAGRSAP